MLQYCFLIYQSRHTFLVVTYSPVPLPCQLPKLNTWRLFYFINYIHPLGHADIPAFSSYYWLNILTLHSNFYPGLGSYHLMSILLLITVYSVPHPSCLHCKELLEKKSVLNHLFILIDPNLETNPAQTFCFAFKNPHASFISLLYKFFTSAKQNLFSPFNQNMAIPASFLFLYVSSST